MVRLQVPTLRNTEARNTIIPIALMGKSEAQRSSSTFCRLFSLEIAGVGFRPQAWARPSLATQRLELRKKGGREEGEEEEEIQSNFREIKGRLPLR